MAAVPTEERLKRRKWNSSSRRRSRSPTQETPSRKNSPPYAVRGQDKNENVIGAFGRLSPVSSQSLLPRSGDGQKGFACTDSAGLRRDSAQSLGLRPERERETQNSTFFLPGCGDGRTSPALKKAPRLFGERVVVTFFSFSSYSFFSPSHSGSVRGCGSPRDSGPRFRRSHPRGFHPR